MTRLYLIRHATTAETGTRLTGRLPGVGLDPAGRDQAASTATSLAEVRFRAVYCSPLRRCRETAKVIAAEVDAKKHQSIVDEVIASYERV